MSEFPITEQNRVRRVPSRGVYDAEGVNAVIDACPISHVAINTEKGPTIIPMLFGRREDELLFHGATKSRLMLALVSGQSICVSFTLLDGLVLAKSLFHHSANYRSAVVFGQGHVVENADEKLEALKIISDKMMPGRWEDSRLPNEQEMKATMVASIKIASASAKVRTGGPIDEPEDMKLPYWAGVVPLNMQASTPIPEKEQVQSIPQYVSDWIENANS